MDEKDLKIIKILMKNGRIPKTNLASALEITEAAVRKRLANLEKQGIILGFKAVINYKLAGFSASLTGIDVEPEKMWRVVEKLRKLDEIKGLWLTTGDHTLMAEIVADTTDELSKLHDEISRMEGVKRVCPSIILEILK